MKRKNQAFNKMKSGLLIGINYTGTSVPLKGPKYDVKNIGDMLQKLYNFSSSNLVFMSDDLSKDNELYPSKKNIMNQFNKLITNASRGDELVFFFSGHGVQVNKSVNMTECLYPIDANGKINLLCDNELKKIISKTPPGTRLVILLDTCHSSGIFELAYTLQNLKSKEFVLRRTDQNELTDSGDIIMFSSALASQLSYDLDSFRTSGGLFTGCLIKILGKNKDISFLNLLQEVTACCREYSQTPQMSFSRKWNVEDVFEL